MSLAYKLWKIGKVLTKEDIEKSLRVHADFKEGIEPVYLNIDFTFENDMIKKISLNKNSILMDKLFFTKKIGGTSNAFYLYPNISIYNDIPTKGINNIKNTLLYVTLLYCNNRHKKRIIQIIDNINNFSKDSNLNSYEKNNYIIWLSINGKTVYELMPEVWDNYYEHPFIDQKNKKLFKSRNIGYDIFSNEKTEIGYKIDFKVYSYDQYHKYLEYRLDDNLSLSNESARNIKYAWIYILDNLVFYYKGFQYVVIPNILNDNESILKTVLKRFVIANHKLSKKRTILQKLKREEEKLQKGIKKLNEKKKDTTKSKTELENIQNEINKTDLGLVQELNEQAQNLEELVNTVTLDYIFVNINRKNLSFEINGTIEDVIPSRIHEVVVKMQKYKIKELVKLGSKDRNKTYLQDYFSREELECMVVPSKSTNKERSNELKNYLIAERLFLAKLLLTDTKIKRSDLLRRFEYHRNFDYDRKKRIKDGFQEWIQYTSSFVKDENNLLKFLNSLNKIQED